MHELKYFGKMQHRSERARKFIVDEHKLLNYIILSPLCYYQNNVKYIGEMIKKLKGVRKKIFMNLCWGFNASAIQKAQEQKNVSYIFLCRL